MSIRSTFACTSLQTATFSLRAQIAPSWYIAQNAGGGGGLSFLRYEAEPIASPSGHGFSRADRLSSGQGFQPLRDFIDTEFARGRRPRIVRGLLGQVPLYRVPFKIARVQMEVGGVSNPVIAETALPDREAK